MNDTFEVTQHIIEDWLEAMRQSVEQQDLAAHMALVSKNVKVYGLPKNKEINYQSWQNRRKNEFTTQRLHGLVYKPGRVRLSLQRRIAFEVEEHMLSSDGTVFIIMKDIMLEREQDDCWRVVEETIREWRTINLEKDLPEDINIKHG